ncbi:hypothetical protein PV318_03130 [Streptomyces sp. ME02-6991-2B]|nr:hypothetical protein [Streptomyces sp. ME02-6991-2B]
MTTAALDVAGLADVARDYVDGPRHRADLLAVLAASDLALSIAEPLYAAYRADEATVDALLADLAAAADHRDQMRADHRATDYGRDYAAARYDAAALDLAHHIARQETAA